MAKKAVTIKDVAKRAGVSVATVSAVLNERVKKVPLSKAAQTKVLQAIKDLNYQVNYQARALRTGRSYTIGVIASDLTQPFTGEVVRLVEAEANKRDYHFLLSDIQNDKERERFYLELFRQKQVEGILFIGASNERDGEAVSEIVKGGTPVVLTEREVPENNVPCVLIDNVKGAFIATNHLVKIGRKHIAYIRGPKNNVICKQRCQGYLYALSENNLSCDKTQIIEGGIDLEAGYNAMQELLSRDVKPDSVFAFNDMLALGAMRVIREHGLTIPDDIAVVGFDDIPIASYSSPALTTVKQPAVKMCGIGVELLLDILDGKYPKDYYKRAVLEPELIIRESCGAQKTFFSSGGNNEETSHH